MAGKKIRKILAGSIAAIAVSVFIPLGADVSEAAGGRVTYLNIDDNMYTADGGCMQNGKCEGHIIPTGATWNKGIIVDGGIHRIILEGAVKIAPESGAAIDIRKGGVILELEGTNNSLEGTGSAGIAVQSSASLTIKAKIPTHSLYVSSLNGSAAGIGGYGYGNDTQTAGKITIEGGHIFAKGSGTGAGIGGVDNGGAGDITISGSANVEARGGEWGGNGIGCGGNGYSRNDNSVGSITIRGEGNDVPTVTAIGGDGYIIEDEIIVNGGAGIGGSRAEGAAGDPMEIKIEAGVVTATGGDSLVSAAGPGIGGKESNVGGKLTISNGAKVTATGGYKLEYDDETEEPNDTKKVSQKDGVICESLSSANTSGTSSVSLITNGVNGETNCERFWGLIYDPNMTWIDVYNTVNWPWDEADNKFKEIKKGTTVTLKKIGNVGATLIFPSGQNQQVVHKGVIKGEGSIVNGYQLIGGTGVIVGKGTKIDWLAELSEDDIIVDDDNRELPYTGKNRAGQFYTIKPDRQGCKINVDPWNLCVYNADDYGTASAKPLSEGAVDAGEYILVFEREGYNPVRIPDTFKITPKNIADDDVKISTFPEQTYTGKKIEPKFDLTYNEMTLKKEDPDKDYEFVFSDNTSAGMAKLTINACADKNYTGTKIVNFKIKEATVTSEMIEITVKDDDGTENAVYNGKGKDIDITLKYNGQIVEKEDYEESKSFRSLKNAGSYSVTITGKRNFTGTVEKNFEIKKKSLEIKSAKPVSDTDNAGTTDVVERTFNGSPKIEIKSVEVEGIVDGDKDEVEPFFDKEGILEGSDARRDLYEYVSLTGMDLHSDYSEVKNNYTFAADAASDVKLIPPVQITRASPEAPKLIEGERILDEETEKYTQAVKIENIAEGVEYEYSYSICTEEDASLIDKIVDKVRNVVVGWQKEPVFDDLVPGTKYCFVARTDQSSASADNWHDSGTGEELKIRMPKLEQDPPEKPVLHFRLDDPNEKTDEETGGSDEGSGGETGGETGGSGEESGGESGGETGGSGGETGGSGEESGGESGGETGGSGEESGGETGGSGEESGGETGEESKITFSVIVPEIEGCEYCFGDPAVPENWSGKNTHKGYQPESECTVYIRYAETETKYASEYIEIKDKVPGLTVETPVITTGIEGVEFVDETTVTITCGTDGATIYYTLDGSVPSAETGIEYKEPFKVSESADLKAIAVREYMQDSEIVSMKLTKMGGYADTIELIIVITNDKIAEKINATLGEDEKQKKVGDKARVKFKRVISEGITEVPKELEQEILDGEEIQRLLCTKLAAEYEGYNYDKINYYEVTLYYVIDNELIQVTAENFPEVEGGFPFEMPYPAKANGKSDDYIVGHMFSQTSEITGTKAGDIEVREEKDITKSEDKLEFTLSGTSPLAVAWKTVSQAASNNDPKDDENNSNNGGNNDGNSLSPASQSGGAANGSGSDSKKSSSSKKASTYGAGTSTNGSSGSSADSSGNGSDDSSDSNKNDEDSSASDKVAEAIQTGDINFFIPWIILLVVSAGVIIGIIRRRRG